MGAQCRGNFAGVRQPFAGIDFFAADRIEIVMNIRSNGPAIRQIAALWLADQRLMAEVNKGSPARK
jgi:hypothetical protein